MTTTINASTSSGLVNTADTSGVLQLQTANTAALTIDASQNTAFAGKITSAGALTLASNGTTTAVTVDTSQNVGIGTSSPTDSAGFSRALDIVGTGGAGTYYRTSTSSPSTKYFFVGQSPTAAYLYNTDNTPIFFYTNSTERMRIDSSGRV